jgi:hypothetical protein
MSSNNNDTISNIINNNKKNSGSSNKTLLMTQPMMPMFSIKNIIVGSVGTLIPWLILLFIVGFIIVI